MSNGYSSNCEPGTSKRLSTSGTSLYTVLELTKGANEDDIKKAYRKLALRFHPDKNREDPSAADRFKEINRAHSVLADPGRKAVYDKYGSFGLNLASQVGEERAAMLMRMDSPCFKVLLVLVCLFTGCCYCCFCYCIYCCRFCCGRYAPTDEGDGGGDADFEAGLRDLAQQQNNSQHHEKPEESLPNNNGERVIMAPLGQASRLPFSDT